MEMTAGQPSSSIGRLTKNTRDSTKNISDPHSYLIIHPLDSRNHLWATTKYHIQVLKVLVEVVTFVYLKINLDPPTPCIMGHFKIKVLLWDFFKPFLFENCQMFLKATAYVVVLQYQYISISSLMCTWNHH